MSKQGDAKKAQGYIKASACCKTCKNFSSTVATLSTGWGVATWSKESNKRCGIGGFSVQSSAHCDMFVRAKES